METETLSKYEKECPSKEDISHDQFGSTTEKHVTEDEKKLETKVTDICDSSTLLENDSDEDVEEEEKLMLSPTHSDKDYDTDEDQEILSAEENGKDEDSDEEDMVNKTEGGQGSKIIEENDSDIKTCEVEADKSSDDDAENEGLDEKKNDELADEKVISEQQETEGELNNVEVDIGAQETEGTKFPDEDIADTSRETVDTTENTADATEETEDTTEETVDTTEKTVDTTEKTADTTEETVDTTEKTADTTEEITDTKAEEAENTVAEVNVDTAAKVAADIAAEETANTTSEVTKDTAVAADNASEGIADTAANGNANTEQNIESEDPKGTKELNKNDESEGGKEDTMAESSDKVEIMDTNQGEDENKVNEEISKGDKDLSEDCAVKTEDSTAKTEDSDAKTEDCPLLKETLTKPKDDEKPASEEMDMDEMEDFDPSLLCPDMSMEVEENSVITDNDALPPDNDASKGVLSLCEPIFSTFVDEITGAEVSFGLSLEEISLREQTYGLKNPVQFTKIHCTACNVHLGSALDGQGNRFVHPLLKVLICKKCYHFYTSGEFEKDEDGSELYCRWCGQGGQVMCCSSCEMVFCKKCIRINFDRKKLTEIRDSDEWKCFACNPSQLIHLRIHCSSFMDYVQREMGRVSSVEDQNTFLHTDYSRCCLPVKKKATESATGEPRRKRRKNVEQEDPDYDPLKEEISEPPIPVVNPVAANSASVPNRLGQSTPKTEPSKVGIGQTSTNTVTRVGSVNIRPMGHIQRPKVQVINPAVPSTSAGVGYTRVLPTVHRGRAPAPRYPAPSPARPALRPPVLRPIRPLSAGPPPMKHEWFEKTVRAAARVNSNLSYTLTQLNRAQANATSVEGLAVVHNKLQEILSTSINSLIQIRKNLRSEFIVGIKNIRFPNKNPPPPTSKSTAATVDDDVIIVSPSSSPPPPPLLVATPSSGSSINLPPSVSLFKRSPVNKTTAVAISSVAGPSGIVKGGTTTTPTPTGRPFLRVKSFSALQSVSSECITIPDDPPPPPPKTPETPRHDDVTVEVADSPVQAEEDKEEAEKKEDDDKKAEEGDRLTNGETRPSAGEPDDAFEMKKLLNPKIIIEKSDEIDELAKSKFGLQNGESEL